jgi:hypothetical protein
MSIIRDLLTADHDKPGEDLLKALGSLGMSELEKLVNELQLDRDKIRKAQILVQKFISHRVSQESAMRKLAQMSSEEQAAVERIISPKGIESKSAVGTPGAK